MAGYREHSYDPNAVEGLGRPLRPYNKVQWTGLGLQLLAFAAYAYHFAMEGGWVPGLGVNTMMFGLPLLMTGMMLTYSRREGQEDLAPELAAARKRWLAITVAICVVVLGAATILDLQGAS